MKGRKHGRGVVSDPLTAMKDSETRRGYLESLKI